MIYRHTPTQRGFSVSLDGTNFDERDAVCPLYPENKRENILSGEELTILDRYPFRPVILAKLSPKYELDLNLISGLSGYGRFAVVRGGEAKWLDEFETIETEYSGGMMIYKAADQLTGVKKVTVKFIPSADDPGLVIDTDMRELDGGAEIYLLHGGMLGWNCHSPLKIPYCPDMCWGNRLRIGGGLAEIVMTGKDGDPAFPDCPVSRFSKYDGHIGDSAASAWLYIKGWEKKVLIRAEGEISAAPADSLIDFRPDRLKPLGEAYGAAVCVRFGAGKRSLAAVGFGGRIADGSLTELEENSVRRLERITGTMTVKSDDTVLDSASVIASLASRAIFGGNVFTHGAVSWKEGFLGWRGTYGPAAFGMTDEVKKHFEYHFRYSRITEGPDRGALCDTIENAGPKNTIFYGMYETAVDQAKNYWEYTGDREFEKDLLDVAEGCISRACRRLKPGKEMLFENSLNTWISDSHWTIMGQCAQSTAYMYNIYRLAARLSMDEGKKEYYAGKADEIKKDLNDVLWQKRRGIFAYARDMRGNHLIHPDAELADIYHPIEFGLTDKYQAFQMLDWAESNLKIERTDNGGTLFWSSGWYPNAGRTYTHSTYELNMGEEMNLALAYMYTGLTEKGYDVFKTAYMAMFGGREPDIRDTDMDKYTENGHPPHLLTLACDIPCQVSINGTPRRNALFGDSVGMLGKALVEGVLGIRPEIPEGRIILAPHLPGEIHDIAVDGRLMSYRYKKTDGRIVISYELKADVPVLRLTLTLPVAKVDSVTLGGKETEYSVEPNFASVLLHADISGAKAGEITVGYTEAQIKAAGERISLYSKDTAALSFPGEKIQGVFDPQGLLSDIRYGSGEFKGRISAESGSGVFFLDMKAGDIEYIRPVRLNIRDRGVKKLWKPFREEYGAPYIWKTVDMDRLFSGDSPLSVLSELNKTAVPPKPEYSQVNYAYYRMHLVDRNIQLPSSPLDDSR